MPRREHVLGALLLLALIAAAAPAAGQGEDARDLNRRGLSKLFDGHDPDGAIADFDAAIRLEPGFGDAYFSRANAKMAKRDAAGALADLSEAVRLKPDIPDVY